MCDLPGQLCNVKFCIKLETTFKETKDQPSPWIGKGSPCLKKATVSVQCQGNVHCLFNGIVDSLVLCQKSDECSPSTAVLPRPDSLRFFIIPDIEIGVEGTPF